MILVNQLIKIISIILYLASLIKHFSKSKTNLPALDDNNSTVSVIDSDISIKKEVITKKSSFVNSLFSLIGLISALIALLYLVIYLFNKFYVPRFNKTKILPDSFVEEMQVKEGIIRYYIGGDGPPLLLLHSIHTGGSSHELESIFNYYSQTRKVVALDLLGFGISDRPDIRYTSEIYTRHIKEVLTYLNKKYDTKIDVIALSLSSEYIVTIASEIPELINKLVLISPTGLGRRLGSTFRGLRQMGLWLLKQPVIGQGIYNLLTTKTLIKYYLNNYIFMDSSKLSESMLDNYYKTTHISGSKHAPSYFIGGMLFVKNIFNSYINLKNPTLIIRGTGAERVTKFDDISIVLKRNNNVTEEYITNGGTLPYIEKPDEFFNICDKIFMN